MESMWFHVAATRINAVSKTVLLQDGKKLNFRPGHCGHLE